MRATQGGRSVGLASQATSLTEKLPFHVFIAFCIVANTAFVYIQQNFQSDDGDQTPWLVVEIIFQCIFTFEAIMKLKDQHVKYFQDSWNLFDAFLVVIGFVGCVFNIMVNNVSEDSSIDTGQARLVNVAKIFRMLRIIRLFRLMRFWAIIKAKWTQQHVDFHVAERMTKAAICSCFVRAHIHAQKMVVKYFGRDGNVDTVEVARCVLQSQTFCYRAMLLEIKQKELLKPCLLTEVCVARQCKTIVEEFEDFVVDAHNYGVLSNKEAETIIHVLNDSISDFVTYLFNVQQGKIDAADVERANSEEVSTLAEDEEQNEGQKDFGVVNQLLHFDRKPQPIAPLLDEPAPEPNLGDTASWKGGVLQGDDSVMPRQFSSGQKLKQSSEDEKPLKERSANDSPREDTMADQAAPKKKSVSMKKSVKTPSRPSAKEKLKRPSNSGSQG
jgi:hypothetical protein